MNAMIMQLFGGIFTCPDQFVSEMSIKIAPACNCDFLFLKKRHLSIISVEEDSQNDKLPYSGSEFSHQSGGDSKKNYRGPPHFWKNFSNVKTKWAYFSV